VLFPMADIESAYARIFKRDVKYRFVIGVVML
jgi:hypothetical protein